MSRKVNVLSLFDGMGCGYLALRKCGVNVGRYVAYEVDKYCIATTTHNIKIIEHKGDVFDADFSDYRGFDFLMGGSPCTYWSIAKQDGKREKTFTGLGADMFNQYMRALEEVQPKFFIYENVASMSNDIREAICAEFGFDPIMIDSALVSAQTRKRLYWVGRRVGNEYVSVHVKQPEDKGMLLRDILDSVGYDINGNDKSYALTARYGGATPKNTLTHNQRSMVAVPVRVGSTPKRDGTPGTSQSNRIYSVDGKGVTLQTHRTGGANGGNCGLYAIPAPKEYAPPDEYKVVVTDHNIRATKPNASGAHATAQGYTVTFPNSKVGSVTSEHARKLNIIEPTKNRSVTYPIYRVKKGKIKIKGNIYPIKLKDGYYIIRKLSVRECMRLQTVPKRYEFPVSDTQAYRMLGNGWTVSVIAHLIESIRKEVRNGRVYS